jgi:hypothetical protein
MPIILGAPRSGTTLLRFMLDSHSELAIPPETGFFSLGPNLKGKGDKLRKEFFRAVINFPIEAPSWPDFEIPEATFWESLREIKPFTIAEGYRAFYRLYSARFGKLRSGDKTPHYCMELDTIRKVLPEARFIHIIRDGRAASLSLKRMPFSPGGDIETLAAYWRTFVLEAQKAGKNCPDYIEVRYEDLVLHTAETLKQVCRFIELDYEDSMLRYYERTPARLKEHKGRFLPNGAPLLTQEQRIEQQKRTTEPPDEARVFSWKSEMSEKEKERFRRVAGDLLSDLGYEDSMGASRRASGM